MKIFALLTSAVFLFGGCASAPESAPAPAAPVNAPASRQSNAERQKIATQNEVTLITQAMQKLEQQGRDMENLRQGSGAESRRQCEVAMAARQEQIAELSVRAEKLSSPFNTQLTALVPDLNSCVSCAANARESCVKTRAAVNQTIKDVFNQ